MNAEPNTRSASTGARQSTDAADACPVCRSPAVEDFLRLPPRDYLTCCTCEAIFVPPAQRPSAHVEAAHYDLLENAIDDPGYRRFLSRLLEPLLARIAPGAGGLDFGCGPGPALAHMLREAGHPMALFDPLFQPDATALQRRYDFITCTEVAEHLHDPAGVFERLFDLLRPNGLLAVMTGFPPERAQFAAWHYRRDPTHVVFYRPETLEWLARRHGADCEIPCRDVALMRLRR